MVNEDADQRTLLRKYERELRKLRAELTRRNKELVDKRHLLEVRCHPAVYAPWGVMKAAAPPRLLAATHCPCFCQH